MICALCEQDVPQHRMSDHHLKTRGKDRFDTALLCAACHKTIHTLFSNKELRDETLGLDTIEGLQAHPQIQKALVFIRKIRPGKRIKAKLPRERRRRKRRH